MGFRDEENKLSESIIYTAKELRAHKELHFSGADKDVLTNNEHMLMATAAYGADAQYAARKEERKLETKEALQEVLASEETKKTISKIVHEGVAAELNARNLTARN